MAFKRQSVEEMQAKMEQLTAKGGSSKDDPSEWKLQIPKEGKASAIIRFLPPGEESRYNTPFIVHYQHGFKDKKTGKWLIEGCPTTIGQECPICKENSDHWNAGRQDIARHQKRKKSFWANVLVVKDPQNPDNNGKVFKYRFGQKIFDKIQAKMNPQDDLGIAKPMDVTCPFEGANFALRAKLIKDGNNTYPNYDDSEFLAESSLGSDDEIEAIANQLHDLQALIDPESFKSEAELQKAYTMVKGGSGKSAVDVATDDLDDLESELDGYEKSTAKNSSSDDELDDLLGDSEPVNKKPSGDSSRSELDDLDDLLS